MPLSQIELVTGIMLNIANQLPGVKLDAEGLNTIVKAADSVVETVTRYTTQSGYTEPTSQNDEDKDVSEFHLTLHVKVEDPVCAYEAALQALANDGMADWEIIEHIGTRSAPKIAACVQYALTPQTPPDGIEIENTQSSCLS